MTHTIPATREAKNQQSELAYDRETILIIATHLKSNKKNRAALLLNTIFEHPGSTAEELSVLTKGRLIKEYIPEIVQELNRRMHKYHIHVKSMPGDYISGIEPATPYQWYIFDSIKRTRIF